MPKDKNCVWCPKIYCEGSCKKVHHNEAWLRDHYQGNISQGEVVRDNAKAVLQKCDGKIINEFASLTEASRYTGVHPSNISYACRGKLKKAGGFEWQYA